jgi:NADP-dependent 3-hydroxy acid dehydrogenase YdfG
MTRAPITTAIVTGASRGIGAAVARHLASAGIAVVVNYATNEEAAARTTAAITAAGGTAHAVRGDVADAAAFANLFDEAERLVGPVAMLVNNAGLMAPKPIAEVEDDWFARLFAVNVGGTLNSFRLAATRLTDGGAIVNLSTSVIGMSPPGYGPYCASKAAVEALTRQVGPRDRGPLVGTLIGLFRRAKVADLNISERHSQLPRLVLKRSAEGLPWPWCHQNPSEAIMAPSVASNGPGCPDGLTSPDKIRNW